MSDDPGEKLFERYLEQRGYTVLPTSQTWVPRSAPTTWCGPTVPSEPGGSAALSDLRPLRRKISAGAEQFKGIGGYTVIVVIANPYHIAVPLLPSHPVAAMYGDLAFEFLPDGTQQWRLGCNGRLHVDEPDGTSHGNHPYLSAVGVLRVGSALDMSIIAYLREHAGAGNPLRPQ